MVPTTTASAYHLKWEARVAGDRESGKPCPKLHKQLGSRGNRQSIFLKPPGGATAIMPKRSNENTVFDGPHRKRLRRAPLPLRFMPAIPAPPIAYPFFAHPPSCLLQTPLYRCRAPLFVTRSQVDRANV